MLQSSCADSVVFWFCLQGAPYILSDACPCIQTYLSFFVLLCCPKHNCRRWLFVWPQNHCMIIDCLNCFPSKRIEEGHAACVDAHIPKHARIRSCPAPMLVCQWLVWYGIGMGHTVDGRNPAQLGNHGKSLFVGIYRGIIIPGFLRWCTISSIHSMICYFVFLIWVSIYFCFCLAYRVAWHGSLKGEAEKRGWAKGRRKLATKRGVSFIGIAMPRTSDNSSSFKNPYDCPTVSGHILYLQVSWDCPGMNSLFFTPPPAQLLCMVLCIFGSQSEEDCLTACFSQISPSRSPQVA